jgi:L-lactate dehydrogenase complex protein LldG
MASARIEILTRVRDALADQPGPVTVPREYQWARAAADVAGLLAERVADYRAIVHRVSGRNLPSRIEDCLRARGASRLAVPADVPHAWQVPGVDWSEDSPPLSVDEIDAADGVLTGCAVAIAETGTIVLDAGDAQGRRVLSLLPDYHLCVVRAEQVTVSVPEALARLDPTRPLTFISGPSASSDIELDRVEGVHGPRTLGGR